MMSIGEYVRQQPRQIPLSVQCTIADYYERAAAHQKEAVRLIQAGDAHQAKQHSSLARKHAQAALDLNPVPSQNESVF